MLVSCSFGLACATWLGACRADDALRRPASPWVEPAGTVANEALAAVARDAWEWHLRADPIGATLLGDHRYDAELALPTPQVRTRDRRALERLRDRLAAIDPAQLDAGDRLTWSLLREDWDVRLAEYDLEVDYDSWNLDPLYGAQNSFLSLPPDQPSDTPAARAALLERWGRMSDWFDAATENLRRGAQAKRFPPRTSAVRVLDQLDAWLATPPQDSALVTGVPESARTAAEPPRFANQLLAVVTNRIYPSVVRYREVIVKEILPHARDDQHAGVSNVPGGARAYATAIRRHTTLALAANEIHAIGESEVQRIRAEIVELGERVFGTRDMGDIQRRLREDPALHFLDADEIEARAREALARAQEAEPRAFGRRPRSACVVEPIPDHEAPSSTIGYYREPAQDGSRPGRYCVNTYRPTTRTRYDAEALAFHESVPGHHLQIALSQELESTPLIQRHLSTTAFVEGWALYSERLADELGLYSGDVDRLGMLSFDAWRACRLVVDTGLHALGWSRQQAIDCMTANTLLAPNNIENEVDRTIAWPGQALAYKLGALHIARLRQTSEGILGSRFSLKAFHDTVLGHGPVNLPQLERIVQEWIAAGAPAPAATPPGPAATDAADVAPPASGD